MASVHSLHCMLMSITKSQPVLLN